MSANKILDLEMLTPGSTWLRENGKLSRFLFLTNTSLPPSMAQSHPQAAVYADEDGNILSVSVDAFIGKRTFHNVDPDLEHRLENLLAFSLDTGTPTEDIFSDTDDALLLVDGDAENSAEETSDGLTENFLAADPNAFSDSTVSESSEFTITYIPEASDSPEAMPQLISPQRLAEITESYEQEPLLESSQLLHKLMLRATSDITYELLRQCFSPKNSKLNAVYTFAVESPAFGKVEVDWDALVGIYPCATRDAAYFQVMFTTNVTTDYSYGSDESAELTTATDVSEGTADNQVFGGDLWKQVNAQMAAEETLVVTEASALEVAPAAPAVKAA